MSDNAIPQHKRLAMGKKVNQAPAGKSTAKKGGKKTK